MILLQNIVAQMQLNGIFPPEPLIADKKIHRFKIDQNDHKMSGWYRGYLNYTSKGDEFYVFIYGDHHAGELLKAQAGIGTLDKFDKKRIDSQIDQAVREFEKEKLEAQKRTAVEAKKRWENLSDKFGKNEYLEKKKIPELFGARIDGFDIAVPMRDINGDLKNIETISQGGRVKKGMYQGQRDKLFHTIGELKDVVYICEGFSTAVSVHMSMGECAICTFNSGNMPLVAEEIAKHYPQVKIIVCADNDRFPSEKTGEIKNVGVEKAQEAAKVSGGKYIVPEFQSDEGKPTDFNDLYVLYGPDEVRSQISTISPDLPVESFDLSYIMHNPYPDENEATFKRKGTIENVAELIRRLRIVVRYNVISKEEEILIPGASFTLDNQANATLAHIQSWCERVQIPSANLGSFLTAIADRNIYNPVVTWIESRPWDGKPRFQELCNTIVAKGGVETQAMKETLIRKWMLSAVAAAYEPTGVSAHGVLVLQGDQYLGKTKWFKNLVPSNLGLLADGVTLRPDNDDSVLQVISKWLVELGEMDGTLSKSDSAHLKSFLTRKSDEIRRKYARKSSIYARRTVFFGSVNEVAFLKDPTGNRRFWTIECEKINFDHGLDMQQVWAEVREFYRAGESWYLTQGELEGLNAHNENFQQIDPIEDMIRSHYNWDAPPFMKKTAGDVCKDIGIVVPNKSQTNAAGSALRKILGFTPKKVNGQIKYPVPPPNRTNSFIGD